MCLLFLYSLEQAQLQLQAQDLQILHKGHRQLHKYV